MSGKNFGRLSIMQPSIFTLNQPDLPILHIIHLFHFTITLDQDLPL